MFEIRVGFVIRNKLIALDTTLVFRAGTAENLSLMDSNERKNSIGTPKLKTNFSGVGNIFSVNLFEKTLNCRIS